MDGDPHFTRLGLDYQPCRKPEFFWSHRDTMRRCIFRSLPGSQGSSASSKIFQHEGSALTRTLLRGFGMCWVLKPWWCRGPDLYIAVPERNSGSRSLHDGREKGRWFDLHHPHQIILKQRLLCQQGSAQFAAPWAGDARRGKLPVIEVGSACKPVVVGCMRRQGRTWSSD